MTSYKATLEYEKSYEQKQLLYNQQEALFSSYTRER